MAGTGRHEVVRRIVAGGVVAIVRTDDASALADVTGALAAGGIDAIEFTMTTPGALDMLASRAGDADDAGGVLLGAGTVLDAETARAAILSGARFLVTPTFNPDVVTMAHRYDVGVIIGTLTPTEMLAAWEVGADLLKVFPATAVGPQYFKDVLAPLPQLRLVPVGGVSLENAGAFIRAGAAAIAVGSSLVNKQVVRARDWTEITGRARRFVAAVRDARGVQAVSTAPGASA